MLLLQDLAVLYRCNCPEILLKKHVTLDEKSRITFYNIVGLLVACCLLSFCHSRDYMK